MGTTLYYQVNVEHKDFIKRLLRIVKNNIWLYIPDLILIGILVTPPYELEKTVMIITGLLVLAIRDLDILRRTIFYLSEIKVEDQMVSFSIMKYNDIYDVQESHISNVELVKRYKPYRLVFRLKNQEIHQQYAIGFWKRQKLEELYRNFNDLKQGISIDDMFKNH